MESNELRVTSGGLASDFESIAMGLRDAWRLGELENQLKHHEAAAVDVVIDEVIPAEIGELREQYDGEGAVGYEESAANEWEALELALRRLRAGDTANTASTACKEDK